MEFSINFDTVKSGWYIISTEVILSKKYLFFSVKINFVLANGADPDEMPHNAAFHQGLHCLPKYLFRGFKTIKG